MKDAPIISEQAGFVRRIWLNRPEARNAQSRQMLDWLAEEFANAGRDEATRVVLLGAKGPHFSAGHDLKQAQAERAEFSVEERWDYESTRYHDYCLRIWDFPKPVIVQVQGACVAAGFMLANMADLIVASDDAFFSDPVTHTMGGAATEVLIHPWVLGLRRAKEFLFTGERMSAAEAKELGMVNRIVPRDHLDDEALALAAKISKGPPFALRLVKKSLNRSMEVQGLRTALSAHFDLHQLSHVSDEYRQANAAGLASGIERSAKA